MCGTELVGAAKSRTFAAGVVLVVVVGLCVVPLPGRAQSDQKPPTFEVSSVKPNSSPDSSNAAVQFLPGGRFVSTNVPLIRVIAAAWGLPLQTQRLTLGSGVRMPDEVYDIEATSEASTFSPGVTAAARYTMMKLMLQALLEDRFKLSVRREPKEQPVYALVVGKSGPRLEKSKFQEPQCSETIGPKFFSNPACHWLEGGQDRGLHGASVTIAQIVESVQNSTDRPLLDKTGLTGFYNIQTEGWAPMRVELPSPDAAQQRGDASADNPDRPTLFNIFEKLGLQMESQRAVIDMFVIDHVEKPSPD